MCSREESVTGRKPGSIQMAKAVEWEAAECPVACV
jgi:hypothetical protein